MPFVFPKGGHETDGGRLSALPAGPRRSRPASANRPAATPVRASPRGVGVLRGDPRQETQLQRCRWPSHRRRWMGCTSWRRCRSRPSPRREIGTATARPPDSHRRGIGPTWCPNERPDRRADRPGVFMRTIAEPVAERPYRGPYGIESASGSARDRPAPPLRRRREPSRVVSLAPARRRTSRSGRASAGLLAASSSRRNVSSLHSFDLRQTTGGWSRRPQGGAVISFVGC